jgi:hypothetical protein
MCICRWFELRIVPIVHVVPAVPDVEEKSNTR